MMYISHTQRTEPLWPAGSNPITKEGFDAWLDTQRISGIMGASRFAQVFAELVADICARNGISLKSEFRHTYVTVLPLLVNFVVFRADSLLNRTAICGRMLPPSWPSH
jgi:hypothetical protein